MPSRWALSIRWMASRSDQQNMARGRSGAVSSWRIMVARRGAVFSAAQDASPVDQPGLGHRVAIADFALRGDIGRMIAGSVRLEHGDVAVAERQEGAGRQGGAAADRRC